MTLKKLGVHRADFRLLRLTETTASARLLLSATFSPSTSLADS